MAAKGGRRRARGIGGGHVVRAVIPPRPARRQPSPAPRCPTAVGHGPGPYPVVLFLHGSGGFWSNDTIPNPITPTNALASQFRD
jgi:hypothetical protein